MTDQTLLRVEDLRTTFRTEDGLVHAVNGISYSVNRGEALGIVGESGSGKSVGALSVMRLIPSPPGTVTGARVEFKGRDLLSLSEEEMRRVRGNDIAMIFQEPLTSLNPVFSVGNQIAEPLLLHQGLSKRAARDRTIELLQAVGIANPERRADHYPHQLSGGLRQRAMIAMALACTPDLLIADEPTTALDVSIQAQILELMRALQQTSGTAMLFITHDLGVVAEMCDSVAVMYAGRIVERATTRQLFSSPKHPYTWGLFDCLPKIEEPKGIRLVPIVGQPPNLLHPPRGCTFHPRCPYVFDRCRIEEPPLIPLPDGQLTRCWLYDPARTETAQSHGSIVDGPPYELSSPLVAAGEAVGGPVVSEPRTSAQSSARPTLVPGVIPEVGHHIPTTIRRAVERSAREAPTAPAGDRADLVVVRDLRKYFPITAGLFRRHVADVRAVDDISFTVKRGETLGLVGESGCGKSTTGRVLLRLLEPTSGRIEFDGHDVTALNGRDLRALRRRMQIVFQDPYSSLNPRRTVGGIIAQPLKIHGVAKGAAASTRVSEILELVGLNPRHADRYPHEFSGGQRQRIGVARAIAANPDFIVADEPVSALDVSIQAQVINLLQDLQQRLDLSYLFISHNLSVVRSICDRVAVMYLGQIVELASNQALYETPLHPYTMALLTAVPKVDPGGRSRIVLPGDVPSPIDPPSGCRFHTRCPYAMAVCKEVVPPLTDLGGGHRVACHLYPTGQN
jgi:peptide/nickel transport system ATP-binding protein